MISFLMSYRVTVVIDADNMKKLRLKQVKEIKKSSKSVSFSRIVNDTIRDCV